MHATGDDSQNRNTYQAPDGVFKDKPFAFFWVCCFEVLVQPGNEREQGNGRFFRDV